MIVFRFRFKFSFYIFIFFPVESLTVLNLCPQELRPLSRICIQTQPSVGFAELGKLYDAFVLTTDIIERAKFHVFDFPTFFNRLTSTHFNLFHRLY